MEVFGKNKTKRGEIYKRAACIALSAALLMTSWTFGASAADTGAPVIESPDGEAAAGLGTGSVSVNAVTTDMGPSKSAPDAAVPGAKTGTALGESAAVSDISSSESNMDAAASGAKTGTALRKSAAASDAALSESTPDAAAPGTKMDTALGESAAASDTAASESGTDAAAVAGIAVDFGVAPKESNAETGLGTSEPDENEIQAFELGEDVGSIVDLVSAAAYIREKMIAREESIAFAVPTLVVDAEGGKDAFSNKAASQAVEYYDGCGGQGGDALKWSRDEYEVTPQNLASGETLFSYTFGYHSSAAQEAELTARVNVALASLALDGKTDYEKAKAIHDWICDNVNYEYDTGNAGRYSAWSAAVKGKAVCQGYAVLFYRMCQDAGLTCRIVGGSRSGGPHGWNLVYLSEGAKSRAGGAWYNVDCTYDGQDSVTRHTYFLRSDADFAVYEYVRGDEYKSLPSAGANYSTGAASGGWNLTPVWSKYGTVGNNPIPIEQCESNGGRLWRINETDYNYTVKGDTSGKNKVYVFLQSSCPRSLGLAEDLNGNIGKFANDEIYLISTAALGNPDIVSFKSKMKGSVSAKINFMYGGQALQNDWMKHTLSPAGKPTTDDTPIVVYVDGDNRIQYVTFGSVSAATVRSNLDAYCSGSGTSEPAYNKITYILNGGTNNPDNLPEYRSGTTSFRLSAPERNGYTFQGWYQNAVLSGQKVTDVTTAMSGDLTFYAKWEKACTITYSLNGGRNHPDNPTYFAKGANTFVLKNPSKEGSLFQGWYRDAAFVTELKNNTLVTDASTGDLTLYAKWASGEAITYVPGGGANDPKNPAKYVPGVDAFDFLPAVRAGYAFTGWYTDQGLSNKINGVSGMTGALTLYAGWAAESPDFPKMDMSISDGNVLLGVRGTYMTDTAENILAEINRIRLEACQEGVTDASGKKPLTTGDYVPLKWSAELEAIARLRAAEVTLRIDSDHRRPSGKEWNTAKTTGGEQSMSENLSLIGGDLYTAIRGWEAEKADWISGNQSKAGHYQNLINMEYKSVGLGCFKLYGDGKLPVGVAQEFSVKSDMDSKKSSFAGLVVQDIEVAGSAIDKLAFQPASLSVAAGGTAKPELLATAKFIQGGTVLLDRTVTAPVSKGAAYQSSDGSVATVGADGQVTGVKDGQADITASVAGKSVTVRVTVGSGLGGGSVSGSGSGSGGSAGSGGGTGGLNLAASNIPSGGARFGAPRAGYTANFGRMGSAANPEPDAEASFWDDTRASLQDARDGAAVQIDMKRLASVPGDVFAQIKGRDVTAVFGFPDGVSWSVNGKDVTADNIGDIDFRTSLNKNAIPAELVADTAAGRPGFQFSINHEGEFGFTATLSMNVGSQYAGKDAHLYYYHPSAGKLEDYGVSNIEADGSVKFAFTHASEYLIAVGEPEMPPAPDFQNTQAGLEEGAKTENGKNWALWLALGTALLASLAALAVVSWLRRDKIEQGRN